MFIVANRRIDPIAVEACARRVSPNRGGLFFYSPQKARCAPPSALHSGPASSALLKDGEAASNLLRVPLFRRSSEHQVSEADNILKCIDFSIPLCGRND